MKQQKKVLIVSLSLVVLMLALACGGSEPVPMSDIPVYDGATVIGTGDNPDVDVLIESLESEAAADENVTAEFKVYTLPPNTTWDDVKSFYTDELADTDWKLSDEILQDTEAFKMIGWERTKQGLGVGYVPAGILEEDSVLLIMLATES